MSKVKEITFSLKKGLPNYSSVSAGMTVTIENGEDLSKVWDTMKQEVIKQCNEDESWINERQEFEKKLEGK